MTENRLPLADLLAKAGNGDFLRSVAEAVVQLLMEPDVEGVIGPGRYERSGDRTTYRNGYRDRSLDTRLGSLQLRIPKLRPGSYFPLFIMADVPSALKTHGWAAIASTGAGYRYVAAKGAEQHRAAPTARCDIKDVLDDHSVLKLRWCAAYAAGVLWPCPGRPHARRCSGR